MKSYHRDWAIPRACISRLLEQDVWAGELIHDMKDAGVYIVGNIEEPQADDFVFNHRFLLVPLTLKRFSPSVKRGETSALAGLRRHNEKLRV